jgi:heptaprenyl diphosphate synthase
VKGAASKLPVLGALALFLSTIEYMIPKPLPFMRLGLANAPLIIALRFPPSLFFPLVGVKILGQALVSGTLFSYVFLLSLSGTLVSAALMYALRRVAPPKYMSLAGISAAGALFSNAVQIALARFFFLGPGAVYIAPPLLAVGLVSGGALGFFCEQFTAKSAWYRGGAPENAAGILPPETCAEGDIRKKPLLNTAAFPPTALFGAGFLMSLCIFFADTVELRLILFFVAVAAALASGKAGNLPFTLLFFAAIVFFNTLSPYGRVICVVGAFPLTEGALLEGIKKAAAVEGLVMVSRVTISPRLRLPGRAGGLLAEALRLFPRFLEKKKEVRAKTFIKDIDRILMELSAPLGGSEE